MYKAKLKEVLLHVGPHKTGSSYLQTCFAASRQLLRERGIVLPQQWEHAPGTPSHTGLVRAVQEGGELAAAEEVLEAGFAEGGHCLLASAEDLCTLKPEALQRLRGLLGNARVRVVFYVRRWSDLIPSSWQELIKHGQSMSLPEYLVAHLRNPEASSLLNFELRIKPLMEVFGPQRMKLVCYSALMDNGIDIFRHFANKFLDWPDAPRPDVREKVNFSRGSREVELLRQLNMLEVLRGVERSAALRVRYDQAGPSAETANLFAAMESSETSMMFTDGFPPLLRLHKELRQKYQPNIVGPGPGELFFRLARKDIPYVDTGYLLTPGVAEALRGLHERLALSVT